MQNPTVCEDFLDIARIELLLSAHVDEEPMTKEPIPYAELSPANKLHRILKHAPEMPKDVEAVLFALVEGLVKERDEWKRRAAKHGCDTENGDIDCG